jgi:hypothetical protein
MRQFEPDRTRVLIGLTLLVLALIGLRFFHFGFMFQEPPKAPGGLFKSSKCVQVRESLSPTGRYRIRNDFSCHYSWGGTNLYVTDFHTKEGSTQGKEIEVFNIRAGGPVIPIWKTAEHLHVLCIRCRESDLRFQHSEIGGLKVTYTFDEPPESR